MGKKTLLGLTLTTCLTAPAAAETWYLSYYSADVIAYADMDSFSRSGDSARINVLFSHETSDYHTWSLEFDCQAEMVRILDAANLGIDKKYLSTPEFETVWQLPEHPLLERLKGSSCDGAPLGNIVSDPFDDADEYWYYYYEE